jgi:hypothetical protein
MEAAGIEPAQDFDGLPGPKALLALELGSPRS